MPIDPTEPVTHNGTDRRAFLTRSAAGGALLATVATTGFTALVPGVVGAQEEPGESLTFIEEYVTNMVALELAASVAYSAALSSDAISAELSDTLRQFQGNHQAAAAALLARIPLDDEPGADPAVAARFSPAAGADEAAISTQLASLEEALAATHLSAIDSFDDSSFAKLVAQVLAVEEQQAATLGRAAGTPLDTLTPATASTDGVLEAGQPVSANADDTEADADSEPAADPETEPDAEADAETDANANANADADAGASDDQADN